MQPTIAANGACPSAVALTCCMRLQLMLLPAVKRSLPALSRLIASAGETDLCWSLVKAAQSCARTVSATAANGKAAAPQHKRRREIMAMEPSVDGCVEATAPTTFSLAGIPRLAYSAWAEMLAGWIAARAGD